MKSCLLAIFVIAFGWILLGIIQILREQMQNLRDETEQRSAVKEDLRVIYEVIKMNEIQKSHKPASLQGMFSMPELNNPLEDYTFFPSANDFEPIVVYNGDAKRAVGYCVFANGIINNGKVSVTDINDDSRK